MPTTKYTHYVKLTTFCCLSFSIYHLSPSWLIFISLIITNDVETNPGDFANGFFNFCNCNLNSLAKDNFSRVELLAAHNTVFNYDIISAYATCLNASVELPDTMLENYIFVACNNPSNTRRGTVGLFYKNDLPLEIRMDLAFDESIVAEIIFGWKRIFLLPFIKVLLILMDLLNFSNS